MCGPTPKGSKGDSSAWQREDRTRADKEDGYQHLIYSRLSGCLQPSQSLIVQSVFRCRPNEDCAPPVAFARADWTGSTNPCPPIPPTSACRCMCWDVHSLVDPCQVKPSPDDELRHGEFISFQGCLSDIKDAQLNLNFSALRLLKDIFLAPHDHRGSKSYGLASRLRDKCVSSDGPDLLRAYQKQRLLYSKVKIVTATNGS